MPAEKKLISVKSNGDAGHLVRLAGYQHEARSILEASGAKFSLQGYEVSEQTLPDILPRVEEAAERDRARVTRDRLPVSADLAATLKLGDVFDFGGDVGPAPIVGIGMVFTPRGENPHDERVLAFDGRETVFLYNANPPGTKPQFAEPIQDLPVAQPGPQAADIVPDQKALAPSPQSESDRDRIVVVVGSVSEGDMVIAWGQERPISALGRGFILAEDKVEGWRSRFPEAVGLVAGAEIQYAKLAEPRHEAAPGL